VFADEDDRSAEVGVEECWSGDEKMAAE